MKKELVSEKDNNVENLLTFLLSDMRCIQVKTNNVSFLDFLSCLASVWLKILDWFFSFLLDSFWDFNADSSPFNSLFDCCILYPRFPAGGGASARQPTGSSGQGNFEDNGDGDLYD